MAAFMELCPVEQQNMVYQNIHEVNEDYEKMKQRVVSWVSNNVAQASGSTPMDIGVVYDRYGFDGEYTEGIAAIGNHVQCHGCGGWGHLKRDCPTSAKWTKEEGEAKGKT